MLAIVMIFFAGAMLLLSISDHSIWALNVAGVFALLSIAVSLVKD
jgi:hypothetical protein